MYYTERKPKNKKGGGLGTYSSPNRKCVSETIKGRVWGRAGISFLVVSETVRVRPIGRGTLISPT